MPLYHRYFLWLLLVFCLGTTSRAQPLSFRHLGIDEGMPSNLTSHACFDSTGLVWISTYDGLIGYDGSRMHQYLAETHPGLNVNVVEYLYCDSRNRIWICSEEGLSLLDEHRRMQRIVISDTLKNKNVNGCAEIPGVGMIVIATGKTFLLPEGKTSWQPYTWFDETVRKGAGMARINRFSEQIFMFVSGQKVMLVNFIAKKIILSVPVPGAGSLCRISDRELVVTAGDEFTLYRIDVKNGTVTRKYENVKDQEGNPLHTLPVNCEQAADGRVYITTRSAGLVSFDPQSDKFYSYRHQPLNKNSISADHLRRVHCHRNGYMIITSATGLNFTNVLVPSLQQQNKFADETGAIIDNVTMAGADQYGLIWVSNLRHLMAWNPVTNKARHIPLPAEALVSEPSSSEAGSIIKDNTGNMWVSFHGKGLAKFTAEGRLLRFLTKEKDHLPSDRIRIVRQLNNNQLIVGTEDGFYFLNPVSFAVDSLEHTPILSTIRKKRVVDILPDGNDVWIAASPKGGAYCYNLVQQTLRTITTKEGLSSDRVYCIGRDSEQNVYIGTYEGLNVVSPEGKISVIDNHNGLRHLRVDNIISDKQGRLWITNFHTLICYTPADKSFVYFDEQNGVSNAGFTVGQRELTKDGNLLFCNNGILIADTKSPLNTKPFIPEVTINRMYDDGGYDLLDPSVPIKLPYNNAKITLYYLSNTLIAANRFFYRYKMEDLDTGWLQPVKNNMVTYNLRPGNYVFTIQTSYNEGGWHESTAKIKIRVLPPWWQTWWFRILAGSLMAAILFYIYRRRIRSIKAKEQVKQQLAELEGKALRAQMNPHFIFNSLNAIQELIITQHTDEGYRYLSSFSKLLRMVLNNSEKNFIPLSAELEMIQLYLSLEALRFRQSFTYEITVDEKIEQEFIQVPSLLLQPYVENAVWHGLRHKEGAKKISIRIAENIDQLQIEIEDNGIGREKAAEIKMQKIAGEQFESKGMKLSLQRIALLNQQQGASASTTVIDKKDTDGTPAGTVVVIQLPNNLTTD